MRDTDPASPSEVGVRGGRLYLNGATVMTTSTDRQLAVAREAGFSGIEARAERLTGAAGELGAAVAPVRTDEGFSLNGVRLRLRPDGAPQLETPEADLVPRAAVRRAPP